MMLERKGRYKTKSCRQAKFVYLLLSLGNVVYAIKFTCRQARFVYFLSKNSHEVKIWDIKYGLQKFSI